MNTELFKSKINFVPAHFVSASVVVSIDAAIVIAIIIIIARVIIITPPGMA